MDRYAGRITGAIQDPDIHNGPMDPLPALDRTTTGVPPSLDHLPVTVLQFGEGNFLRAFADWMIDRANRAGLAVGRIQVVQPLPQGLGERLNAQDGLYHVAARGIQDGRPVDDLHLVASVAGCLDPYRDWAGFLALAARPELRWVLSNTTESGIAYQAQPSPAACPATFPAKVAAFLAARHRALGDDQDAGLVFLPCELIEANGQALRSAVFRHLEDWGEDDTRAWVAASCTFCDTLVDRIVPGYPAEEAAALQARIGATDGLIAACEAFHLWIIQGPASLRDRLPLDKAGCEVVWTDDLRPYRTRKVRILNGAHTGLVAASLLAGVATVREAVEHPVLGSFLRRLVEQEILPGLAGDPAAMAAYARSVHERFANPHIRHAWSSIALNSLSKWTVRVLPSLESACARHQRPAALTLSLAALLHLYRPAGGPGAWISAATGAPLQDDGTALARLAAHHAADGADDEALVRAVLADTALWGRDLTRLAGVAPLVARQYGRIRRDGILAAVQDCLAHAHHA